MPQVDATGSTDCWHALLDEAHKPTVLTTLSGLQRCGHVFLRSTIARIQREQHQQGPISFVAQHNIAIDQSSHAMHHSRAEALQADTACRSLPIRVDIGRSAKAGASCSRTAIMCNMFAWCFVSSFSSIAAGSNRCSVQTKSLTAETCHYHHCWVRVNAGVWCAEDKQPC